MTTQTIKNTGWPTASIILKRELIRFTRQPARIGAAIGTPLILWVFMASGFSGSMSMGAPGVADTASATSYSLYLLPGMMTLVAMFTAIFSSISIIEDRTEGWLQSVLVAPAPRWSIAAGKILGGSILAFAQAIILLLALPMLGGHLTPVALLQITLALAVTCLAMTGVGVAFAWVSESTQGFHAVMNLILMPLWMLSGAFFSTQSATGWLRILMYLNPLTWATWAIRSPLNNNQITTHPTAPTLTDFLNQPPWYFSISIAILFAITTFTIATFIVAKPRKS